MTSVNESYNVSFTVVNRNPKQTHINYEAKRGKTQKLNQATRSAS